MVAVLGKRSRSFDVVGSLYPPPNRRRVLTIATVKSPAPTRTTRSRRRISSIIEEEDAPEQVEETGDCIILQTEPETRTPKRTRRCAPTRSPLSSKEVNVGGKSTSSASLREEWGGLTYSDAAQTPNKLSPPQTPSRRGKKLQPPTTPRHRVCVVSKPMTPRSKLLGTPTHAATPTTVITSAKSLFSRSTRGGRLIGRDEEREKLQGFLKAGLASRGGGCLYISGPPGCGKSALLMEMMGELVGDETHSVKKAWINCMSLHTPGAIYGSLLESFSPATTSADLADLEALFITPKKSHTYVLVLDEIDHLLSQDLLPTLFELSLRKNSRLVLIGIANALDLADRFLPRLKAKGLEPTLLPFLPYTAPQISAVLTARLRSLLSPTDLESSATSFLPLVHPAAIQLLAKKVAVASGDLRKAFDILRRALELLEMENLAALRSQHNAKPQLNPIVAPPRQALSETTANTPSTRPTTTAAWTATTAPRASLAHVAKAATAALGASVSSRIAKLNAHQKAVLCVLVAQSGTAAWGLKALREAYARACGGEGVAMMPLVGAEFRGVVEAMEAVGVLDVVEGKRKGEERIVARVGRMELLTAVGAEGTRGREGLIRILGA